MSGVRVEYHPKFAEQYLEMADLADISEKHLDVFGEVTMLMSALETYGHGIEEDNHHAGAVSHPIVTSRYQAYALRRTPPTSVTPYADSPPILRMPYVWFVDQATKTEVAVLMLIGDKSESGNAWYPAVVNKIDNGSMVADWERIHPGHKARTRRQR